MWPAILLVSRWTNRHFSTEVAHIAKHLSGRFAQPFGRPHQPSGESSRRAAAAHGPSPVPCATAPDWSLKTSGRCVDNGCMTIGEAFPDVLAGAVEGDERAWTRLFHDLAGPLLGYVKAQGAVDPEDLVSEVFLHLARGIGRFEGDERQFRSWVFVIAHHRVLDERRRRRRHADATIDVSELPGPVEAELSPGSGTEDEVLARFAVADIRALVERLRPAHRDVLLLRILGGLTIEETARAIGKRAGATKALQRRAVLALQGLLAESGATPEISQRSFSRPAYPSSPP